jgi:hypothetical protein
MVFRHILHAKLTEPGQLLQYASIVMSNGTRKAPVHVGVFVAVPQPQRLETIVLGQERRYVDIRNLHVEANSA